MSRQGSRHSEAGSIAGIRSGTAFASLLLSAQQVSPASASVKTHLGWSPPSNHRPAATVDSLWCACTSWRGTRPAAQQPNLLGWCQQSGCGAHQASRRGAASAGRRHARPTSFFSRTNSTSRTSAGLHPFIRISCGRTAGGRAGRVRGQHRGGHMGGTTFVPAPARLRPLQSRPLPHAVQQAVHYPCHERFPPHTPPTHPQEPRAAHAAFTAQHGRRQHLGSKRLDLQHQHTGQAGGSEAAAAACGCCNVHARGVGTARKQAPRPVLAVMRAGGEEAAVHSGGWCSIK